ncbi:major capsid protein [Bradyrhizobium liaoningense]
MADYLASNFKIYQEYLKTRAAETLQQQADVFNAAVNGAIILRTVEKPGDYEYESFFKDIANLVSRRDNTSTSAATKLSMAQDEFVRVKLSRKIGPVDMARDAFRKWMGRYDATEFSGILGEQIAVAQQLDMANSALLAARAALVNVSSGALMHTASTTTTTADLIDALAKFGDRADRIVAWVMHSKPYYDLTKSQVTANITGVSNFNVQTATPVTLNRPVLVTDSDSLKVTTVSPAETNYYTLGLTANGVLCEVTETNDVVVDDVTGLEVLMTRLQGEFAYNLGLKGFKFDVANGGTNPNATAVGTGANWDKAATYDKALAGVVLKST